MATVLTIALLATSGNATAVNINVGQASDLVIGATSHTAQGVGTVGGSTYFKPHDIELASDGKVLLTDTYSHRIASFNGWPAANGAAHTAVFGKFSTSTEPLVDPDSGCTSTATSQPTGADASNGKLAIAARNQDRVMLWNAIPADNTVASDWSLGSSGAGTCWSFDGVLDNLRGGLPVNAELNNPTNVWTNGTKILVTDSGNNRVLVYNSWPTAHNPAPSFVLGQPNMTTNTANTGGIGLNTMNGPGGVWSNGTKVLVADEGNNRVLVWDTWPTANGQNATTVIGQPNATTNSAGCSATKLDDPRDVDSNGTRIIISDSLNHRVAVYSAWPAAGAHGGAMNFVLGQANQTSCSPNRNLTTISASTLREPWGVAYDGATGAIMVSDYQNSRALKWTTYPVADGPAADAPVIGATSATGNGAYGNDITNPVFRRSNSQVTSSIHPTIVPGGGLLVGAGTMNNVKLWAATPTTNHQAATWRFGQLSNQLTQLDDPNGAITSQSMDYAAGIWTNGTKLLMVEANSNRVKVWNTFPTAANQAPDFVLGQTSLTVGSSGTTNVKMNNPIDVASDGNRVVVADTTNNRVLIWTTWPSGLGDPADLVLGQDLFTTLTANNTNLGGTRNSDSLSEPRGVALEADGTLAVGDNNNNRILIWNEFPTTNHEPADAVFGQANFTSAAAGKQAEQVFDVEIAGNALIYGNPESGWILDPVPTTGAVDGPLAGGPSKQMATNHWNNETATTTGVISGVSALNGTIWLGNDGHHRIMRWTDAKVPVVSAIADTGFCDRRVTVTFTTDESTTTEVYWDTVSRGSVGAYANSSIDTTLTGLGHSVTLPGPFTPGTTYYYRVQGKDWANNTSALSAEGTWTVPATCPAPTQLFGNDTNAQAGVNRPTGADALITLTPKLSHNNAADSPMNQRELTMYSTPLDNVVALWKFDNAWTDSGPNGYTITPGNAAVNNVADGRPENFLQTMQTNGTNQYGSVTHAAAQSLASNFTVEAWVKTASSNGAIVSKHNGTTCTNPCNYELNITSGRFCASLTAATVVRTLCGGTVNDNNWHHVAMTVDSSNNLRIYMDGILANGPLAMGAAADASTGAIIIGARSTTGGYIAAQIDDVRISADRKLPGELQGYINTWEQHYTQLWTTTGAYSAVCAAGPTTRCEDVTYAGPASLRRSGARWYVTARLRTQYNSIWSAWSTADWVEADLPVDPDQVYVHNTNAQTSGVPNAIDISNPTPTISFRNRYGAAGDRQRVEVRTTTMSNVVGLWRFNNPSSYVDNSNYKFTAIPRAATNDPTTGSSGRPSFSEALVLDADDAADIPYTSVHDLDVFTVEAWFMTSDISVSSYPSIITKDNGTANSRNFKINFNSASSLLSGSVSVAGTPYTVSTSSTPVVDGAWHHVALVNGSDGFLRLYVDGVEVGTPQNVGTNIDNPANDVIIGGATNGFLGSIDDVRISNVARTSGELLGYVKAYREHYSLMWDSDGTDAGIALASCGDNVQCANITYAGSDLIKDGGRFYVSAKIRPAGQDWSRWSTPTWFQTTATMNLTVNSGTATLGSVLPGTDATANTIATITTNNASGYSLTLKDESDTWGMQQLAVDTIADFTSACSSPSTWTAGSSGYFGINVRSVTGGTTNRLSKWGPVAGGYPATDFTANNLYCGADLTTSTLLHQRQTYFAGSDTVDVTYRLNPGATDTSGAYSGTMTYTATVQP